MALNFSWILPSRVAGMARPQAQSADWLKEQRVTAILSLTERPIEGFDNGFELAHVPVRDLTSPTLDQLHAGVGFMNRIVASGGAVVVHCGAGMGRTGTFLAAYFVGEGQPADGAITLVRMLRPGSIETVDQEQVLFRYAELIGGVQS